MKQVALALALAVGAATPAYASLESDVANAAGAGDYAMVKYLTESGANLNVRDEEGYTPLIWAAQHGNTRVAEYLIAHGSNLNPLDRGGYTPLMWAAQEGHFSTVALLLEKGANPWVKNWRGQTAMDLCAMYARDGRIQEVFMKYTQRASTPSGTPVAFSAPNAAPFRNMAPVSGANTNTGSIPVDQLGKPSTGMGVEPALPIKLATIKRLGDVGVRATQIATDFVKANQSNPMALMDPDLILAKDITQMYADLAKDQSLVKFRGNLNKVMTSWNGRENSKFAFSLKDADLVLKEAGL